jgi:hypothetical protein
MFLWLLGWLLKFTVGLSVVFIVWVQISMGICKSKKRLDGKVNFYLKNINYLVTVKSWNYITSGFFHESFPDTPLFSQFYDNEFFFIPIFVTSITYNKKILTKKLKVHHFLLDLVFQYYWEVISVLDLNYLNLDSDPDCSVNLDPVLDSGIWWLKI